MEKFETKEQIISLGKTIVKELKIEPGVDTLSRWMAHYISELIIQAEKATIKKQKVELERECFETILRIWENRNSFPNGGRPFEDFEPIFDTLEHLSKISKETFNSKLPGFMDEEDFEENKVVYDWLKKTIDLSDYTKRFQRFCLSEAYTHSKNEKTRNWLEPIKDPMLFIDTKALYELEKLSSEFYEKDEDEKEKQQKRKGLESLLTETEDQLMILSEIRDLINQRLN